MHNESRLIYWRWQSAASWASERGGKGRGRRRESSGSRVWKDEEIRTDQPELRRQTGSLFFGCFYRICQFLSLICPSRADLRPLPLSLSSSQQRTRSSPSVCPYLCSVLPHLQLSLLPSTTWCSSMYRARPRASDSVLLYPPTPAVGAQPLCCQMMLRAALPLSSLSVRTSLFSLPSPSSSLACVQLTVVLLCDEHGRSTLPVSLLSSADVPPPLRFCSPSISTSRLFSLDLSVTRELPIQAEGVAFCLSESAC